MLLQAQGASSCRQLTPETRLPACPAALLAAPRQSQAVQTTALPRNRYLAGKVSFGPNLGPAVALAQGRFRSRSEEPALARAPLSRHPLGPGPRLTAEAAPPTK